VPRRRVSDALCLFIRRSGREIAQVQETRGRINNAMDVTGLEPSPLVRDRDGAHVSHHPELPRDQAIFGATARLANERSPSALPQTNSDKVPCTSIALLAPPVFDCLRRAEEVRLVW
jgi:hypothetical protein